MPAVAELKPSIFGNLPPAQPAEIEACLHTLLVAFPSMPAPFWGLVAKEAIQQGLSLKRMQYIVDNVLRTHRYSTITIADIFDADCYINELSLKDLQRLTLPHEPLAMIKFGDTWRIVWQKDAIAYGYPYRRIYSNAEREQMLQRIDEQRHHLELTRMEMEFPEISDTVPENIAETLADEFSVNTKH